MSLPEVLERVCQNCQTFDAYRYASEAHPCEKHDRIVREGFCVDCKLKVISVKNQVSEATK
jgi:hypothetical protein